MSFTLTIIPSSHYKDFCSLKYENILDCVCVLHLWVRESKKSMNVMERDVAISIHLNFPTVHFSPGVGHTQSKQRRPPNAAV